jgi:hypothetical protein
MQLRIFGIKKDEGMGVKETWGRRGIHISYWWGNKKETARKTKM